MILLSGDEVFQLIKDRSQNREADVLRLRQMLAVNKELVNAKGRDEDTPLHLASSEGQSDVTSVLIKAGANVNARDKSGYTPLHWAAGKGNLDIVKELIAHKADVNARDEHGVTPLHRAAYWGHEPTLTELIKSGADPDAKDGLNHTPFMMAVWFGKLDAARVLFERMRREDIRAPNVWGMTPLEWARSCNRPEVAQFIERRNQALGLPIDSKPRASLPASPVAMSPAMGSHGGAYAVGQGSGTESFGSTPLPGGLSKA